MKRFLAFIGIDYSADGGMKDFIGDYDNINEAIAAINKRITNFPMLGSKKTVCDGTDIFAHIWDSEKRKIVWDINASILKVTSLN